MISDLALPRRLDERTLELGVAVLESAATETREVTNDVPDVPVFLGLDVRWRRSGRWTRVEWDEILELGAECQRSDESVAWWALEAESRYWRTATEVAP